MQQTFRPHGLPSLPTQSLLQKNFWMFAVMLVTCPMVAMPSSAAEPDAVKDETNYSAALEDDESKKPITDYELLQVFVDTFHQVEKNYVKDVDRRELVEAAVRGMLTELDPYSNYISPDDLSRFDEEVNQEFGGIGIQVNLDPQTRTIEVVSPLPGTPAYKAGIRAGDRIVEIAGKQVSEFEIGDELDTAVRLMRGKPGESIDIGFISQGEKEVTRVKVNREIINVATVMGDRYEPNGEWDYLVDDENKIGYIRLTHFSQKSTQELRDALKTLKKQGMKALILDLRFDPGGLLSTATEVADLFIESGKIVSTKGRNTKERVWTAVKPGTYSGFPMAVLVNHYSASASEIVSACLQDQGRAVVIGERSWGKGSVQNVIELENGTSALKLTTASYHRPSGKNIHRFPGAKEEDEWGVMPDQGFEVKFSPEEVRDYLEYRRQRDILSQNGPPESQFVDTQLNKAIDYLKEELTGKVEEAGESEPAQPDDSTDDKTTDLKSDASTQEGQAEVEFQISLPEFVRLFQIG